MQKYVESVGNYKKLAFLLVWICTCVAGSGVAGQGILPDSSSGEMLPEQRLQQSFYVDTLFNDSVLEQVIKGLYDVQIVWDTAFTAPEYADPLFRVQADNGWRYAVLFGILFLLACVRLAAPQLMMQYSRAFFKPRLLDELMEDQRSEISGFSLFLTCIFSFAYALPFQFLLEYTGRSMTDYPWGDYALLAIFTFSYFILRFFMQALGGRIFEIRIFTTALLYSSVVLNFFLSLIFIPVYLYVLLNDTGPGSSFLMLTVVVAALSLMALKVVRSLIQSAGSFSYPAFYLILYLCALEIAPWLFLYRIIEINLI
jgi:hypothetical protein